MRPRNFLRLRRPHAVVLSRTSLHRRRSRRWGSCGRRAIAAEARATWPLLFFRCIYCTNSSKPAPRSPGPGSCQSAACSRSRRRALPAVRLAKGRCTAATRALSMPTDQQSLQHRRQRPQRTRRKTTGAAGRRRRCRRRTSTRWRRRRRSDAEPTCVPPARDVGAQSARRRAASRRRAAPARDAGYSTAYLGKYHLSGGTRRGREGEGARRRQLRRVAARRHVAHRLAVADQRMVARRPRKSSVKKRSVRPARRDDGGVGRSVGQPAPRLVRHPMRRRRPTPLHDERVRRPHLSRARRRLGAPAALPRPVRPRSPHLVRYDGRVPRRPRQHRGRARVVL